MSNSPIRHPSELITPYAFLDNMQPAKNETIRLYLEAHFIFIFTLSSCDDIVSLSERTMFACSVSCSTSVWVNWISFEKRRWAGLFGKSFIFKAVAMAGLCCVTLCSIHWPSYTLVLQRVTVLRLSFDQPFIIFTGKD